MAMIQCKMCGGTVELPTGVTSGECPYCGSVTTFPKITNEQTEQLYSRAEHFRQANDFDKAVSAYEKIIQENPEDPEAYWGLVLSRFGIEYVEDPASHERIPTCHRVQYESILADFDYQNALLYAPDSERGIYEEAAKRIAEIQKQILAISAQEAPYDVFICYKETSDGGTRTKDSALAQDVYYQLTNEKYKVFFARITLEDKLGQQYEPYIFAALNSAKVMLVIGSKKEYFNAVWVRNEWSRFLQQMKKDRSKLLIPCYSGMDAYDLPEELSMFQSQDMSKIGFIQDLLRGVKKVLNKKTPSIAGAIPKTIDSDITNLLNRISLFLEDKNWDFAAEYCEKVLDIDAKNSVAYFYKVLISAQLSSSEELPQYDINFKHDSNFQKALRFASPEYKQKLEFLIQQQNENCYNYAILLMQENKHEEAIEYLKKCIEFKNSAELINICKYDEPYQCGRMFMEQKKYPDALESFKKCTEYLDAKTLQEECEKKLIEEIFAKGMSCFEHKQYDTAICFFEKYKNFTHFAAMYEECQTKIKKNNKKTSVIVLSIFFVSIYLIWLLSLFF